MKRIVFCLVLLVTIFWACPAHAVDGLQKATRVCGNNSADTSVTVVAAASSTVYRVLQLFLSSDAADEIELKSASTTLLGLHSASNAGLVHQFYPFFFEGGSNEALTISKTGATDLHYCVWYIQKK